MILSVTIEIPAKTKDQKRRAEKAAETFREFAAVALIGKAKPVREDRDGKTRFRYTVKNPHRGIAKATAAAVAADLVLAAAVAVDEYAVVVRKESR